MAHVIVVPQQPGFNDVFKSRDGIVGRDLSRRATRVQAAAISQAGLKTGALKRNLTKKWINGHGGDLAIQVGSDVPHALVHHEGSRPHVIRARNAKALRYVNSAGDVVFARGVHHPGTRANRYLTDNLPLAVR